MRYSLAFAAAAVAAAIAIPSTADAQVRVRVGARVTVGGSVSVGWRPARRLRRIYRPRPVNVYYYYPTYADPPPPQAPESCCQCAESCAPAAPAPAPTYTPTYAPAPPTVYTTYQREPRFGIGLRASSLVLDRTENDDGLPAEGVGLLLRMRLRSNVELELDLGHDKFQDLEREDTRLGAALYLPLTRGRLAPYVVIGAGVNAIMLQPEADPINQGYLEAGAGLAWKLAPSFSLSADLRWSARKEMRDEDDRPVIQASTSGGATTTVSPLDEEKGVEGRLSGILYF